MRHIRRWFEPNDASVPHGLRPSRTLVSYVREAAERDPGRPALLFEGNRLSYSELDQLSDAFAAGLFTMGVKWGDRVVSVLPSCPQLIVAALGTWKSGAIAAPLDPALTQVELEGLLPTIRASVAVGLTQCYPTLKKALEPSRSTPVITTNIKEYMPPRQRVMFSSPDESADDDHACIEPGDATFQELLAEHANESLPSLTATARDAAVIVVGRTSRGNPTLEVGHHSALVAAGLHMRHWLASVAGRHPLIMLCLPLHQARGMGVLSTSLVFGDSLAFVPDPSDAEKLVHVIADIHPTFVYGSSNVFAEMLRQLRHRRVDLASVEVCISCDPLSAHTRTELVRATGGHVVDD